MNKLTKNSLLLVALLSTVINAQELYYNMDKIRLGEQTLKKKYCQPIKKNPLERLCYDEELTYPISYKNKALIDFNKQIEPFIKNYKKVNPKKEVLDAINDMDSGGEWTNHTLVNLFAITNKSYTLAESNSNYSGGAHGSFYLEYQNYTKDGKKITLDTLFAKNYQTKLLKISEKVYREQKGLSKNDSLIEKDGWFEDKFILPKTFAITPNGLLFFYNQYEIKAYASGTTEFLLPYNQINKLIKPDSLLLDIQKVNDHYYYISGLGYIHLNMIKLKQNRVKITVDFKDLGYHDMDYLSLSFPDIKSKKRFSKLHIVEFKKIHVYGAGSMIYNQELKKAVKSHYTLVEANGKKEHSKMSFIVDTKGLKELNILIHATFKDGKKSRLMPDDYNQNIGQQGYSNYTINYKL